MQLAYILYKKPFFVFSSIFSFLQVINETVSKQMVVFPELPLQLHARVADLFKSSTFLQQSINAKTDKNQKNMSMIKKSSVT